MRQEAIKLYKKFSDIDHLPKKDKQFNNKINFDFFDEQILINKIDYYYSNSISRASKTMSDCRSARQQINKNWNQQYIMNYFFVLFDEIYKILFLLIPILVSVAMIVWFDRRVWGLVQKRKGPNVVGPFGLLQTVADAY